MRQFCRGPAGLGLGSHGDSPRGKQVSIYSCQLLCVIEVAGKLRLSEPDSVSRATRGTTSLSKYELITF